MAELEGIIDGPKSPRAENSAVPEATDAGAGPGLLLHVCCGPCATVTVDHWRSEGVEPAGLFFNPNIQPLLEFRRRLEGARELAVQRQMMLHERPAYDPVEWFERVGRRGEGRCFACVAWRLDETARAAVDLGLSAISTSLAISPYQDREAIREGGERAAAAHGVSFLYADLRPLYRRSREETRSLGLYRQQYCGCIVSEWERYRDLG